jgi:hypothetical protein
MKRSKKPAAKNSLAPTMKSRAPTKHAIQNEHALAEWAPQLWAADTQKLVRLVRNYRVERVNAATMARGVHRANSCGTTRAPAQLADVVVPMLRGA